jgi:hypothetical protein
MPDHKILTADLLEPHPERERARRRRLRGLTAWIIQWVPVDVAEHPLEEANPSVRTGVVSILAWRIAAGRVCEIAKALYLSELAEPAYLLAVYRMESAPRHSRGPTPITPTYAMVEAEPAGELTRAPCEDRFRFGRDPCLYGRRVRNLREREDGTLDWDEIPIPPPLAGGGK